MAGGQPHTHAVCKCSPSVCVEVWTIKAAGSMALSAFLSVHPSVTERKGGGVFLQRVPSCWWRWEVAVQWVRESIRSMFGVVDFLEVVCFLGWCRPLPFLTLTLPLAGTMPGTVDGRGVE